MLEIPVEKSPESSGADQNPDSAVEIPVKIENTEATITNNSNFWDEDERRLLKDLQRIERSNMNFAERKYYTTLCETIYAATSYYDRYESIADLFWTKNKKEKPIQL